MNYVVIIAFFVLIFYADKISCAIPDEMEKYCTHLGMMNKFVKSLWNVYSEDEPENPQNLTTIIPPLTTIIFPSKSVIQNRTSRSVNEKMHSSRNKIIDGKRAWFKDSFEMMVGIHFNKNDQDYAKCGGILIHRNWILTSEICLARNMFTTFSADRGLFYPYAVPNDDNRAQTGNKMLSKLTTICKLTTKKHAWSDVVLARLGKPIDRRPIRLSSLPPSRDNWFITVGYGQKKFDDSKDKTNFDILWKSVWLVNKHCDKLRTKRANADNQWCFRGEDRFWIADRKSKGQSCLNDAGGPVVLDNFYAIGRHQNALEAVISNLDYEKPCLRRHDYRMYSRIDHHHKLISKITSAFGDHHLAI